MLKSQLYYVIYDCETTDKEPREQIEKVAVGALVCQWKHEGLVELGRFSSLVQSRRRICDDASKLTHITHEMTRSAPPFKTVAERMKQSILKLTKGHPVVWVGYNTLGFDNIVLTCECARHGIDPEQYFKDLRCEYQWDVLPTARKVKEWLPQTQYPTDPNGAPSMKLGHVHQTWTGTSLDNAHDAIVDCLGVMNIINSPVMKTHLNEEKVMRQFAIPHHKAFRKTMEDCKGGIQLLVKRNRESCKISTAPTLMQRLGTSIVVARHRRPTELARQRQPAKRSEGLSNATQGELEVAKRRKVTHQPTLTPNSSIGQKRNLPSFTSHGEPLGKRPCVTPGPHQPSVSHHHAYVPPARGLLCLLCFNVQLDTQPCPCA